MILSSGWGFLAFAFIVLGFLCTVPFTTTFDNVTLKIFGVGLGCLLFGTGGFFLGRWLNITRPDRAVAEHITALRNDLWQRVRAGNFQAGPGIPAPTSAQEAQIQVERVVAAQRTHMERALRNRHTLYMMPMQWWSAVEAVAGLGLMVVALFKALG